MPFAMCCSPNAAVSMSEDACRVVVNVRRFVRTGRGKEDARLREAGMPALRKVAVFIMYRCDGSATLERRGV